MNIVEFPGLWGLKIPVNRVAFEIKIGDFELPIYWYGIIIALAFLVAVLLGMKDSRKFGLVPDTIIDLLLFAAPVAIICARLYYVIFSWEYFKDNPMDIFNIRTGGLAIYGGIIGAIATAAIFARVKKTEILKLFDFGAPYLVLGQAIGRWGNFVNQEAFGTNTTLPWGMTSSTVQSELARLRMEGMNVDPSIPVHPAFLYESLWDLAVFLILIWYRKRKKLNGEVFFLYMALYGVGRFLIEGIRVDSLYIGNLRVSQLLAFLFAAIFGILFIHSRIKAGKMGDDVLETGNSKYGAIIKKMQEEEAAMQVSAEQASVEKAAASGDAEGVADVNENAQEGNDGTKDETDASPETEEKKEMKENNDGAQDDAGDTADTGDAASDKSEE